MAGWVGSWRDYGGIGRAILVRTTTRYKHDGEEGRTVIFMFNMNNIEP
jgi:hypothetical protein